MRRASLQFCETYSMYNKYSATYEWPVKTSVLLQRLLVVAHVIAIIALLICAISPVYKLLLVLSIILSGWRCWRTYGPSNDTVMLRYTDAFGWELSVNNEYRPIRIVKSTVVTQWVIVLHYQLDNKIRHWAIFNDTLNKSGYTQLIVQLKIAGLTKC